MPRASKEIEIPKFVFVLPFPFSLIYKGVAFYDLVLLRKSILTGLRSKSPTPESVGILLHELEHYKRARRLPRFKFAWKYLTDKHFRLEEELAANRPQMAYIKKVGGTYDINKRAKHLSGIIYRWCTDFKTAKVRLEKIWEDA